MTADVDDDQGDERYATVADMRRAGLTYRQIDYWTTEGWLREIPRAATGPGHQRRWPRSELPIAAMMARLARPEVGLDVNRAVLVARAGGRLELAPGVKIVVDQAPEQPGPAWCADVKCSTHKVGPHWHAGPPGVLDGMVAGAYDRIVEALTPERLRPLIDELLVDDSHSEASRKPITDAPSPG
jgi:hypothetical protein